MTILLDTHIIIWLVTDPERLDKALRSSIVNADRRYISSVSFAEVTFKHRKNPGVFSFTTKDIEHSLADLQAIELVLNRKHVSVTNQLPLRHKDPFDHLLMAQAISEEIFFATDDAAVLNYQNDGLRIVK